MHDDESMDRLLRDALAADVPQLPPAFQTRVMRRVRPRRLTPAGRVVMAVYAVTASAAAVWLLRDLPVSLILAAVAVSVPVAAGAGVYWARLAASR